MDIVQSSDSRKRFILMQNIILYTHNLWMKIVIEEIWLQHHTIWSFKKQTQYDIL